MAKTVCGKMYSDFVCYLCTDANFCLLSLIVLAVAFLYLGHPGFGLAHGVPVRFSYECSFGYGQCTVDRKGKLRPVNF
jgi:hypothetical protein